MFPSDVANQYYEAQRLYAAGKAAQALGILAAIEPRAPNHPEIMHARALCLHATGNLREALRLCNLLFSMHGDRRGMELSNKWTNPSWVSGAVDASSAMAEDAPAVPEAPKAAGAVTAPDAPAPPLDVAFLRQAAFLCMGFSAETPPSAITSPGQMPARLRAQGASVDDYNAALARKEGTCLPRAGDLLRKARAASLPVILLQTGFLCPDASDLSPYVYRRMQEDFGEDPSLWPGRPGTPAAEPAYELGHSVTDHVLTLTGDDGFSSTNLRFVLKNLGLRHLLVMGGPVENALGRTAVSARARGCRVALVEDTIFASLESQRESCLREIGADYRVDADVLLSLV